MITTTRKLRVHKLLPCKNYNYYLWFFGKCSKPKNLKNKIFNKIFKNLTTKRKVKF